MVKASLIVGLLIVLVLSGCHAIDKTPSRESAKTISTTGTNAAVVAGDATAQKEESKVKEHKSGAWTPELTDKEKETVFAITMDTLAWCVNGAKGDFSFDKQDITAKLKEPTHTFVTLKINDNLRGCIGSLPPYPAEPLYKSVHENAINAALRDPRFPPVRPAELPKLDVHVSLLSPVKDIKSLDEFNLGEHGIIVEKNGRRGVFLPEVAIEQHWTKEETLNYLCAEKAGLPEDAWKKGAKMQVYSSVVLSK